MTDNKELKRLCSLARHNEASALRHARDEGKLEEQKKWQGVIADKDAENEQPRLQIAELKAKNGN